MTNIFSILLGGASVALLFSAIFVDFQWNEPIAYGLAVWDKVTDILILPVKAVAWLLSSLLGTNVFVPKIYGDVALLMTLASQSIIEWLRENIEFDEEPDLLVSRWFKLGRLSYAITILLAVQFMLIMGLLMSSLPLLWSGSPETVKESIETQFYGDGALYIGMLYLIVLYLGYSNSRQGDPHGFRHALFIILSPYLGGLGYLALNFGMPLLGL